MVVQQWMQEMRLKPARCFLPAAVAGDSVECVRCLKTNEATNPLSHALSLVMKDQLFSASCCGWCCLIIINRQVCRLTFIQWGTKKMWGQCSWHSYIHNYIYLHICNIYIVNDCYDPCTKIHYELFMNMDPTVALVPDSCQRVDHAVGLAYYSWPGERYG